MTSTCLHAAAPPLPPPPRLGEDVLKDIRRREAARWAAVWATREQVAASPDAPGLYLALAPMDGITDAVYRALLTGLYGGHSGISLCVSEFVRVTRDPVPPAVLVRDVPELAHGGCTPAGVPVFVQLLGGAPEPMAETARCAAALGAPGIDLNFGCPARTVNNHDGGACLLRAPPRIRTIVARVRDVVPAAIPVTVKIRVGWDSADALEEIVVAAAAGGASWLTVHARTRTQLYAPPVRWPELARARAAVAIPVVANGDLRVLEDLSACAAQSGCQAFMIGRAAMARPDLFAAIRGWRDDAPLPLAELAAIVRAYHAMMVADGLEPARAVARVKQWLRLAAQIDARVEPHFTAIKALSQFSAIAAHLDTMV